MSPASSLFCPPRAPGQVYVPRSTWTTRGQVSPLFLAPPTRQLPAYHVSTPGPAPGSVSTDISESIRILGPPRPAAVRHGHWRGNRAASRPCLMMAHGPFVTLAGSARQDRYRRPQVASDRRNGCGSSAERPPFRSGLGVAGAGPGDSEVGMARRGTVATTRCALQQANGPRGNGQRLLDLNRATAPGTGHRLTAPTPTAPPWAFQKSNCQKCGGSAFLSLDREERATVSVVMLPAE